MKKARVLAICLTVLLVSATSSFAAVIWTETPATPIGYVNHATNPLASWSATTPVLSGTSASFPLTLSLTFTTSSFVKAPWLYVTGASSGGDSLRLTAGSLSLTKTFAVDYQSSGVYAFGAYVESAKLVDAGATWAFKSATLSDTKPATTPIPAAGLLLGSGLLGLFGIGKARRRKD
ncbi:MAG: hypothetical protein Q7U56_00705 [Humidesulfovibrio sp.]|nr:hypothetical protein [Humidesulfovibrio sp.]